MKKIFLAFFMVLFCSCIPYHFDFKGVTLDGTLRQFTKNAIKHGWEPSGYIDNVPIFATTLFNEDVIVAPLLYADNLVYGVVVTNCEAMDDLQGYVHREMVDKFSYTGLKPYHELDNGGDKTTFTLKSGRIVIYTCPLYPDDFGIGNFVYYVDRQNYIKKEHFEKSDK